jgi:hypothetical protein
MPMLSKEIFARLHPLNGRKRQTRKFRQLALIQAGKRARRSKLSRCYHAKTISYALRYMIYEGYNIGGVNARILALTKS